MAKEPVQLPLPYDRHYDNMLKLCKEGFRLYDMWCAAEFADEMDILWKDYIEHRNSCDICSSYPLTNSGIGLK